MLGPPASSRRKCVAYAAIVRDRNQPIAGFIEQFDIIGGGIPNIRPVFGEIRQMKLIDLIVPVPVDVYLVRWLNAQALDHLLEREPFRISIIPANWRQAACERTSER